MNEVILVSGELYTPGTKNTVKVEINWKLGNVGLYNEYEAEPINSRCNYQFTLIKRGWIFTDFSLSHVKKPRTYKLTFFNRDGDEVKKLLDAMVGQPRWELVEGLD